MGEGLGKPEYERDYRHPPPFPTASSDTYYPNGDHLAAYGGRGGVYPGYPTGAQDPYSRFPPDPYLRSPPESYLRSSQDAYLRPSLQGPSNLLTGPPVGASSFDMRGPPPGQSSFSSLAQPPARGSPLRQGLGGFPSVSRAPMETLIIWDWDDTLMCSTAINTGRMPAGSMLQVEALLEEALLHSMSLGETCIVTNADDLWVYESTRRFAPRILPLLSQLPIVSARRKHEANYPGDVFAWKRETFREIFSARSYMNGLNLVVLGDSPAEIEAAQTATYGLGIHPLLIKTVKYRETPTIEELIDQQRIIMQDLASIVQEDKDSNRNLASRFLNTSVGYMTGYRGASSQVPLSSSMSSLSGGGASYHPSTGYLSSPMMYG